MVLVMGNQKNPNNIGFVIFLQKANKKEQIPSYKT